MKLYYITINPNKNISKNGENQIIEDNLAMGEIQSNDDDDFDEYNNEDDPVKPNVVGIRSIEQIRNKPSINASRRNKRHKNKTKNKNYLDSKKSKSQGLV